MYIRFGRPATPFVYDEVPETLGAGVDVLREGRDISIFACGHMVWRALEAAEQLHRDEGIDAEVVNVAVIKPLASEAVLSSLARTGLAVTAEEHRTAGGLADAIRSVAAERDVRHRRGRDGALRPDRRGHRGLGAPGARPEAGRAPLAGPERRRLAGASRL
jgi:transketolase C-terminal domain/subunit